MKNPNFRVKIFDRCLINLLIWDFFSKLFVYIGIFLYLCAVKFENIDEIGI